jgi:hypothetical protein
MGDRVPFVAVGRSLDIGSTTAETSLLRAFAGLLGVSTSGSVVLEIRDSSSQLLELTIPVSTRSVQVDAGSPVLLPASTDVFARITAAGTSAEGLYGWWEVDLVAVTTGALLTSLDLVKNYASITVTTHDVLLLWLISGVSAAVQTKLGREIVAGSVTGEKHSGTGRLSPLILEHYPVDASSVAITLEGTALAAGDLDVDETRGEIWYTPDSATTPSGWPNGVRNISADYDHGRVLVPADLIMPTTIQVVYLWKKTGPKGLALGNRTTVIDEGGVVTHLFDAWEPGVEAMLDAHKAPRRF